VHVYNFGLAENHNYFVGRQGVLVNNDCGDVALGPRRGIEDFAEATGSKFYHQWPGGHVGGFDPDLFVHMMDNADNIHFNINGFSFTDFQKWI
jgi:hypothetical protein